MGFGDIFNKAWKDYKTNFKPILIFLLIFSGIWSIIQFSVSLIWIIFDTTVREMVLNPYAINPETFQMPWQYFATSLIIGIIGILISLFITAGLTGVSVKKNKFKLKDIINIGTSSYFRYIAFTLVLLIFLIGLFLLFIIPGIIFLIYWTFGIYVLYDEKKGVLYSLKRSREIVRGRWWKVLGYSILIFLILIAVSIVISIISLPTQIISLSKMMNQESLSLGFLISSSLINLVVNFLANLIFLPLLILFYKNFYFEMKKTSKKEEKIN